MTMGRCSPGSGPATYLAVGQAGAPHPLQQCQRTAGQDKNHIDSLSCDMDQGSALEGVRSGLNKL